MQRASALDLFTMLENIVEDEGHELITKVVHVIHKIEEGVVTLKNLVPKVHTRIHQEADEVYQKLEKLADEIQEFLFKKSGDVYYGFDLLSGLTQLTGGTKLSTVISVLQLADKAHKLADDAKTFVPNLEKELDKIQRKIEEHVSELAKHVVKELGLMESLSQSVVKKIVDLLEEVQEEAHVLILNILYEMENTFSLVRSELPEIYKALEDDIKTIKNEAQELLNEISKHVGLSHSYSIFDIAGDFTHGTSLGTAIKVMSLLDKFNTVCQDIRGFGPHAETLLQHSVKKVADHAQEFFSHTAKILVRS